MHTDAKKKADGTLDEPLKRLLLLRVGAIIEQQAELLRHPLPIAHHRAHTHTHTHAKSEKEPGLLQMHTQLTRACARAWA